ncbi:hypothetical protein NPN17_23770, partial [Vibrio parahaemolyticus]
MRHGRLVRVRDGHGKAAGAGVAVVVGRGAVHRRGAERERAARRGNAGDARDDAAVVHRRRRSVG